LKSACAAEVAVDRATAEVDERELLRRARAVEASAAVVSKGRLACIVDPLRLALDWLPRCGGARRGQRE
jgi:predicted MarR family transcription regulator